jgi:hypothetical protein
MFFTFFVQVFFDKIGGGDVFLGLALVELSIIIELMMSLLFLELSISLLFSSLLPFLLPFILLMISLSFSNKSMDFLVRHFRLELKSSNSSMFSKL